MRLMLPVLACAGMLSVGVAHADTPDFFQHNGSEVAMVWGEGDGFVIEYTKPRRGLAIREGTVLVRGVMPANGDIYGTAYVFRKGCKPAGYEVTGRFGDDGTLYLSGKAPIRKKGGCRVVGYASNENSSLVFTPDN